MPHTKTTEKPLMPEIHLNFFFVGKEDEAGGSTIPILVAKERTNGTMLAAAMPTKNTNEYITKRLMALLREAGCEYGDLSVNSGQEEAIKTVVDGFGQAHAIKGGKYVVENSFVGSSASNGVVELAIQSAQGQLRVLLDAL